MAWKLVPRIHFVQCRRHQFLSHFLDHIWDKSETSFTRRVIQDRRLKLFACLLFAFPAQSPRRGGLTVGFYDGMGEKFPLWPNLGIKMRRLLQQNSCRTATYIDSGDYKNFQQQLETKFNNIFSKGFISSVLEFLNCLAFWELISLEKPVS